MTPKKSLVLVTVAVLSFVVPLQAQAALITFSYSGTVDFLIFGTLTPTEFAAGDTFSGTYTFESTTADSNASPDFGQYNLSITSLSATVGSYSASWSAGNIITRDDITVDVMDNYIVRSSGSPTTGPSVLGLPLLDFELQMTDLSATVFSSDALPLVPPDPTAFTSTQLAIRFIDGENIRIVIGTVDFLTPEPSTVILAAMGLVGLAAFGWRRRKR